MSQADRERLADWQLEPALAWLMREGRLLGDTRLVVQELCERLCRAGAPLWRIYIGLQTLHPQLQAMAFIWTRGHPAEEVARHHGIERTSAFLGSPIQEVRIFGRRLRYRLDTLTAAHHAVLHEVRAAGGTDYVGWPLPFSRGEVPVVTLATDCAGGFSEQDLEKLERLLDHLAPIIEAQVMYRISVTLLETYLGGHTGQRILDGLIKRGDGETIRAVLWFSDLRDFTAMSEAAAPERTLAMLNQYFEVLDEALRPRGGEILKFVGDGVLAIFPVADAMFLPHSCASAAEAAADAQRRMAAINIERRQCGEPELRFGVGLHMGSFTYGNIGTATRLDFTVIGPAVNRCARLESMTKTLGVPVLASAEFNANCPLRMTSLGLHAMRGVAEKQELFTIEL